MASIVNTLRTNGEYDSTTLVFVSDNGFNHGSHRLGQKMAPYEESIRVPFVIAGPGIPHATQSALVTQLDRTPTLLDLAGVAVPNSIHGRSLRPLFEGTPAPAAWGHSSRVQWQVRFLLRGRHDRRRPGAYREPELSIRHFLPTWRAVRTERYVYIQWYGGSYHDYELYDLVDDPWQLTNLLATADGRLQYADLTGQLQTRLDQLAICSGLSCR